MGILQKAIKGHSHSNVQDLGHHLSSTRIGNIFYNNDHDDYENVYEFVRPLAQRFSRIEPYAVDKNGDRLPEAPPAVASLYRPNQQMSYTQFFDALATGIKTQPEIYILVWTKRNGQQTDTGKVTPDNISGYTFLQGVSKIREFGEVRYELTNAKGETLTYRPDRVITLSDSRNPYDVLSGYSPIKAVKKWITVDDYIVDYQQGFFRNGAVPAGEFRITAATQQDFEDTVAKLQEAHRGAGQNNNVIYSPVPIDPNTGKPSQAKIEWVPHSVANRELELGTLVDNINKRRESVYGVPDVIRGIDSSANYATSQTMKQVFVENQLEPMTHNIWSTWTHELNRITGGLGYAISYDLAIPQLSDQKKVEAETKSIESNLIRTLTLEGYSIDSIVTAFNLSEDYRKLAKVDTTDQTETNTEVDEDNETTDAPDALETSKNVKQISDPDRAAYEERLADVVRKYMQKQIDGALEATKDVDDMSEDDLSAFVIAMLSVITTVMITQGQIEYLAGAALLAESGITLPVSNYILTETARESYRSYLMDVAQSYTQDTATSIRTVLDKANIEGWTRRETENALQNIMNTDDWRVRRIARTEINRSQSLAGVDAMKQIQAESGVRIQKVWTVTNSEACQYCLAMNGRTIDVDDVFIPLNGTIEGEDGGVYVNDFTDIDTAQGHPNCTCTVTYKVVR